MSNKLTCPSCQSHTSGVYEAWSGELDHCPTCGIPGETIRAIMETRKTFADALLKSENEALVIQNGKLVTRARVAENRLNRIADEVEDILKGRHDY